MGSDPLPVPARRIPARFRARRIGGRLLLYACVLAFVVWVLFPLWFTLMSSISRPAEMVARPPHWIPERPTLDNFLAVFTQVRNEAAGYTTTTDARILRALGMSTLIGVSVAALNLLIGGLAGYGYSRYRFRGSRIGYLLLMVSRVVPAIAIMVPFFIAFRLTGLINSPLALIISYLLFTLPLSVWLLKSYFDALPAEVEEAAMVDGASRLQIIWLVVAPLARPGLVAAGLLVFLESWSEFFYANVLTTQLTVPPLLASYNSLQTFGWNTLAAATVVSLVPPILLAIVFQRYVVTGLSQGAVK